MVSRRSTYSSPSGHVIHLLASTSRWTMRLPLINSKFQLIWPRSGTRRMKPLILSAFRRFPSWRRSSDTKLFGKRIRWTSDAPLFWRFIMLFAFTFTRPAPQIFNQSSCQHPATAAKVYFLFRHFSEILGYNDTTGWNGPIRDALIWGRTGRRTKRKKNKSVFTLIRQSRSSINVQILLAECILSSDGFLGKLLLFGKKNCSYVQGLEWDRVVSWLYRIRS